MAFHPYRRSREQLAAIWSKLKQGKRRIDKRERRELLKSAAIVAGGAAVVGTGVALAASPRLREEGAYAVKAGAAGIGAGAYDFYNELREALKTKPKRYREAAGQKAKEYFDPYRQKYDTVKGAAAKGYEGGKRVIRTWQISPNLTAEKIVSKGINLGAEGVEGAIERALAARYASITMNLARGIGQTQADLTRTAFKGIEKGRGVTAGWVGDAKYTLEEQRLIDAAKASIFKDLQQLQTRDKLRSSTDKSMKVAARKLYNEMRRDGQISNLLAGNAPNEKIVDSLQGVIKPEDNTPQMRDKIKVLAMKEALSGGL